MQLSQLWSCKNCVALAQETCKHGFCFQAGQSPPALGSCTQQPQAREVVGLANLFEFLVVVGLIDLIGHVELRPAPRISYRQVSGDAATPASDGDMGETRQEPRQV